MSYAQINDLYNRYDLRIVNELSSDDNSGTANDTVIQAALDDAAAEILLAVLEGSQYTTDEINLLATNSDPSLFRLNADLAVIKMHQRRGQGLPDTLQKLLQGSLNLLEQIRKGQRVFNVPANRPADTPNLLVLTSTQEFNLGLMSSSNFFGPSGTPTTAGQTP